MLVDEKTSLPAHSTPLRFTNILARNCYDTFVMSCHTNKNGKCVGERVGERERRGWGKVWTCKQDFGMGGGRLVS